MAHQQEIDLPLAQNIELREPCLKDGLPVHQLIERCPPLDPNSSYCNFLQSGHFSSTCAAAEKDGQLVGFTSGYLLPHQPDTMFFWQVAVDASARGLGLASKMIHHILARPVCENVRHIHTTITEDNQASWALFKRLAASLEAELQSSVWLDKEIHFQGQHDSELLVHIGPINSKKLKELS